MGNYSCCSEQVPEKKNEDHEIYMTKDSSLDISLKGPSTARAPAVGEEINKDGSPGKEMIQQVQKEDENARELERRTIAIQRFLKSIYNVDRKKEFVEDNRRFFIDSNENYSLLNNEAVRINFSAKVLEIEEKLGDLKDILKRKYPVLFKLYTGSSRRRIMLAPIKTANNDVYQGGWNVFTNKFNGYGILSSNDGSKYEGFWLEGSLNFYGRKIFANGDYYEGEFFQSTYHGIGFINNSDGHSFSGGWERGLMHGKGNEKFVDGSSYSGDYHHGKKSGKGEFKWSDGSHYIGEVENNFKNGFGEYNSSLGTYYKGFFKNDLYDGKGYFKKNDGSYYEGDFVKNKKSGYGKFSWNDNKYHEGYWSNGKQHGEGTLFKDGKITKGRWNEGVFVEVI
jgi:hypothetical protein